MGSAIKKILILVGAIAVFLLVRRAFPNEWEGFWSWVFNIIVQ